VSLGVLACDLLPGLLLSDLETEFGMLPELDLNLNTDQKRLGFTFKMLPKDAKNDSLLSCITFLTSLLNLLNVSLR
jgi:hypothetical protein